MSQGGQNKTEKATPKRKRMAREKGQIPRSKETVTFVLLFTISSVLYVMSDTLYKHIRKIFEWGFVLNKNEIYNTNYMLYKSNHMILIGFLILAPILVCSAIAIYFGNTVLSGNNFSLKRIQPKITNVFPKNPLKKIFSMRNATDLMQSLLKCAITALILAGVMKSFYPKLIPMSALPINDAMSESAHYALKTFLLISFSTIIYALIDFPFQIYQDTKDLRMSKQEVRDEFKDVEGNPQIKRKIKMMQRRASRKRGVLRDVAKADIVITNPTHYAVAIQYDEETMDAPIIVSMGTNLMALQIRRVSSEHKIPVLEIPLLARALYYHGEVGARIPEALFYAVARVLAYIFKLDDPLSFYLEKEWIDQLPIPEEMITEGKK
jgi:flagellar biosynthetic protein FlhB